MPQSEINQLYDLIRDLTEKVADMNATLSRVDERLAKAEALKKDADALDQRVKALELSEAKRQGLGQGLGMAGKALWAFVGAGGVGVIVAAVNLLRAK